MIALTIIGLMVLVGLGCFVGIAGFQVSIFGKALTGKYPPEGVLLLGISAALFWLAYYLSPFVVSVKVAS